MCDPSDPPRIFWPKSNTNAQLSGVAHNFSVSESSHISSNSWNNSDIIQLYAIAHAAVLLFVQNRMSIFFSLSRCNVKQNTLLRWKFQANLCFSDVQWFLISRVIYYKNQSWYFPKKIPNCVCLPAPSIIMNSDFWNFMLWGLIFWGIVHVKVGFIAPQKIKVRLIKWNFAWDTNLEQCENV